MKSYIFLIILWSGSSFANVENTLRPLDKNDFPTQKIESNLPNLPRTRTQGKFNVCFGMSSAFVAQYFVCNHGKKPISNCASVPPNQEISPLSMVGISNRSRKDRGAGDPSNHYNLKFGGAAASSLGNLSLMGLCLAESCYPFDPIAKMYGSDQAAVELMLNRLKDLYNRNKGKTEADACLDCISKAVQEDLKSNTNIIDIRNALKMPTFEEFLYSVTLGKNDNGCEDIVEINPSAKFKGFPTEGNVTSDQIVNKAREILKQGYPLALDGICPIKEKGVCAGTHSVVITGYREQCTAAGTKCRHVLRVQNSWGEEWQDKNDDGWVDAETMLGKQPWPAGTLTWFSK